jgi:hypothetical protein
MSLCLLAVLAVPAQIEFLSHDIRAGDWTYSVLVNGDSWFTSADTSLRANGKLHSVKNGSLKIVSCTIGHGSDENGDYGLKSFEWGPTEGGNWTWDLRVRNYSHALVFEQHFLSALTGTAVGQEAGDENKILSSFPAFDLHPAATASDATKLGYHQWANSGVPGCEGYSNPTSSPGGHDRQASCPHGLWPPAPPSATGAKYPPIRGGETAASAALAVMDDTLSNAVIISSASEFTTTRLFYDAQNNSMAFGIQGRVTSVPEGHITSTILHLVLVLVQKFVRNKPNSAVCF